LRALLLLWQLRILLLLLRAPTPPREIRDCLNSKRMVPASRAGDHESVGLCLKKKYR
jgi:hypothetical protein